MAFEPPRILFFSIRITFFFDPNQGNHASRSQPTQPHYPPNHAHNTAPRYPSSSYVRRATDFQRLGIPGIISLPNQDPVPPPVGCYITVNANTQPHYPNHAHNTTPRYPSSSYARRLTGFESLGVAGIASLPNQDPAPPLPVGCYVDANTQAIEQSKCR